MNALVAKRDADAWPAAVQNADEELPGFWTFRVQGVACSGHRLGTVTIGGQTRRIWLLHAPRAIVEAIRDQGAAYWCRTLKQIAESGSANELAAKAAWKWWLVDGTYTRPAPNPAVIPVTSYPWTFSGAPGVGVDGAMDVSALVRPMCGGLVLGTPEDYDGEDAAV